VFKDGKVWNGQKKKQLVWDIEEFRANHPSTPIREVLAALEDKYGTSRSNLNSMYYQRIIHDEPEEYRKTVAEFHALFGGPAAELAAAPAPTVDTVAQPPSDEAYEEDSVVASLGSLLEGLEALQGVDTGAFIAGLATIVSKASGVGDDSAEVARLKAENAELRGKVAEIEDDIAVHEDTEKRMRRRLTKIDSLLYHFHKMTPTGKIKYLNKFTWDLRVALKDELPDEDDTNGFGG
jgi:hypothetical protein